MGDEGGIFAGGPMRQVPVGEKGPELIIPLNVRSYAGTVQISKQLLRDALPVMRMIEGMICFDCGKSKVKPAKGIEVFCGRCGGHWVAKKRRPDRGGGHCGECGTKFPKEPKQPKRWMWVRA